MVVEALFYVGHGSRILVWSRHQVWLSAARVNQSSIGGGDEGGGPFAVGSGSCLRQKYQGSVVVLWGKPSFFFSIIFFLLRHHALQSYSLLGFRHIVFSHQPHHQCPFPSLVAPGALAYILHSPSTLPLIPPALPICILDRHVLSLAVGTWNFFLRGHFEFAKRLFFVSVFVFVLLLQSKWSHATAGHL